MRKGSAFQLDKGNKNKVQDNKNIVGIITNLQARYILYIVGIIYAQGIIKIAGAVANRKLQFRMSSTDQYQFLGFQIDSKEDNSKKHKQALFKYKVD